MGLQVLVPSPPLDSANLSPEVSKCDSVDLLRARRGILMRRFLIVLAVVTLSSALTWADSIEGFQVFGSGFQVTVPTANAISCACTDPNFGSYANFAVYSLNSTNPTGYLDFVGQGFNLDAN